MPANPSRIREFLKAADFRALFIEELGWDRHQGGIDVTVDGQSHALRAVAQKRGFQVFECQAPSPKAFPNSAVRRKIERQVTKSAYEHIIIFTDSDRAMQTWQWVKREPNRPLACREPTYHRDQPGDALIQKLQILSVELAEEERVNLPQLAGRVRQAFDVDRVTKRFYEHFKEEHAAFLKFVKNIPTESDRDWYASLMLNRLMFVYFIQKKGYLDGDSNYLRSRMAKVQEQKGKGKFLSFYRFFLMRLFHEGLGKPPGARQKDFEALLGEIPYLNGGLFDVHDLEKTHTGIDIPDEAFERLFNFFDQYQWHLDERPLRADNEINPDVLGYIFEKYINQKQMGAYYTKEDITGYIARNTIIPFLFDAAEKKCAAAFKPGSVLWKLLAADPDRYIYEPVRRGVIDEKGKIIPESALPDFVQKGMRDPKKRMFDRRYNLGEADLAADGKKLTLPTETWREYVARRNRCLELRVKLKSGDIHSINDLITYNLDICQFAEDAVENCEEPEVLRAFWQAIERVSVLDPTCGSGAVLFASLNILEPLYDACLDRMQAFLYDLVRSGEKHRPEKFADFRKTLEQVAKHPNRRYYILKSIVVNNLYGVDIMEEAVEICKLRLFLKLVAQVDDHRQIEPLPDIDFNIRPGNTLVGYATLDQIKISEEGTLGLFHDQIRRIEEDAELVDRAFKKFHEMQTEHDMDAAKFADAKIELRKRLNKLRTEIDHLLAKEYGVDADKPKLLEKWRSSHLPFHWFAEFYGIMSGGGFDVIIGNPPYVVYAPAKVAYSILPKSYQTFETKNLYSYVCERSIELGHNISRVGLIVQLTVLSAERMDSLQNILLKRGSLYTVSFPRRPESVFDGVEMPVSILLSSVDPKSVILSSRVCRFYTEERNHALATLSLTQHGIRKDGHRIAKIGSDLEQVIHQKVGTQEQVLSRLTQNESDHLLYYQEACRYWVKACVGMPFFKRNGKQIAPPHGRTLCFVSRESSCFATCLANSSLFYWFYSVFSDCEHINDVLLREAPIPRIWETSQWGKIYNRLQKDLVANSKRKTINTSQGHKIEYDEIKALLSKPVIDEIDSILAKHYGFTDEELDFIVNYDIKYRMGQDDGADDA